MLSQPIRDEWVPAEGQKIDLSPAPGDEDTVGHLMVVRALTANGPAQRSFWRPSSAELAILQAGGYVMLTIASGKHPPVSVATLDPTTQEPGTIEDFQCGCGGKVFRPFGDDDLMCTQCGNLFTTRPDPEYGVGEQVHGAPE